MTSPAGGAPLPACLCFFSLFRSYLYLLFYTKYVYEKERYDAVIYAPPVMPGAFLLGRGPNDAVIPVEVNSDGFLKVDISSATLSVTADGVEIKNDAGNPIPTIEGLSIPKHDYVSLTYTGTNLTGVAYKVGGSGGTTVATLTLAYSGSQLTSVTKS